MNCNVVKDLLPLYVDGCCSKESEKLVTEHIEKCGECKRIFDGMSAPNEVPHTQSVTKFSKLNEWKASIIQSLLLFISFALITIGVALEAKTPVGLMNGFWASNLVIPATGFMLSLPIWYFVKVFKSKKDFSRYSFITTLIITLCAYGWAMFHYGVDIANLFSGCSADEVLEIIYSLVLLNGLGVLLTVIFCVLSKVLSDKYAKMLGKE